MGILMVHKNGTLQIIPAVLYHSILIKCDLKTLMKVKLLIKFGFSIYIQTYYN